MTGARGFVGSHLLADLAAAGHEAVPFVRGRAGATAPGGMTGVRWNPATGEIDDEALGALDAVVHLAGETVAGRWTAAKKARIRESRVVGTTVLAEGIARVRAVGRGPKILVSASAIGFYPATDSPVDETTAAGSDFLSEVCVAWEAASAPAANAGVRVVHTRFGHVLGEGGGLLGTTLPLFRAGLGGVLGGGHQFMSWVALSDLMGIVRYAVVQEDLRGPVNVVAPGAVTNGEFTKTLGRVLGRPTVFGVPGFALKAVLGEFSVEVMASHNVKPGVLAARGYTFEFPALEPALRAILP